MQVTEQQLEEIIRKAAQMVAADVSRKTARAAAQEVLKMLGMDVDSPREMQQDFAYLRTQRKASEQVGTWTRRALLIFVITSALTLLLTGIKTGLTGLLK